MQFYGIEKRLGRKVYFVLQGLLSCAHCYGVGAAFRCSRMLFILSSATQGQCICNNCHVWGGSHFAFLERLHRGVEGREHFYLHALIGIYVWESQVQKRKLIKQKKKNKPTQTLKQIQVFLPRPRVKLHGTILIQDIHQFLKKLT